MSSPEGLSPSDPEFVIVSQFEVAHAALCRRFLEAARIADSRYQHLGLDTSPMVDSPLAMFRLAEEYDAAVEGRAETFEVGLPIIPEDAQFPLTKVQPRLVDLKDPYFTIRLGVTKNLNLVNQGTYSRQFLERRPLVQDFITKVNRYDIIPLRLP